MAISAPETTGTVRRSRSDGREVTAREAPRSWRAAKAAGIDIPVLCHDERFDPVGVCRMCVVDVGAPAFAASCVRACENANAVNTSTPELERSREMLTRLLISDQPPAERDPKQTTTGDIELLALAEHFGARRGPFAGSRGAGPNLRGTQARAGAGLALPTAIRSRRRSVQPGDRGRPRRLHPPRPVTCGHRDDIQGNDVIRAQLARATAPVSLFDLQATRWARRSCVSPTRQMRSRVPTPPN